MAQNAQGMHPAMIVASIRQQYGTCRVLARQFGVAPSAISHVLTNAYFSTPLERRIAQAIGVPLHVIWPDRWTKEGEALPRSSHRKNAVPRRSNASQKREAA